MKKSAIILMLAVLFLLPLASAGFFNWITGMGTGPQLTNASVELITNTAPDITTPTLTPVSIIFTNNPINCSTTYSDFDLDVGTVTFRWYVSADTTFTGDEIVYTKNVTSVSSGSSALTTLTDTSNGNFSEGDYIMCSVRSFDGANYSSWKNSSYTNPVLAAAPNITFVQPITVVPTENDKVTAMINFTAYEVDGAEYIDVDTATATIRSPHFVGCSATDQELQNLSCVNVSHGTNEVNFSCSFDLWYFYEPGSTAGNPWTINVTVNDTDNKMGVNNTGTFTYQSLAAFEISPSLLTWTGLASGAIDKESNEDTSVNNTGNGGYNNCQTYFDINGTNLNGTSTGLESYFIDVGNFTADDDVTPCNGKALQKGTYVTSITYILAGNLSAGAGNGTMTYCIPLVPAGLPRQNYTTAAEGPWTIKGRLI